MKDKRKIKRRFLLYYMRVYDASTRQQNSPTWWISTHVE